VVGDPRRARVLLGRRHTAGRQEPRAAQHAENTRRSRRSANETLDLFLSGIVGLFIRATDRGDDETAAMLADQGRALVAEQAKLNAAYIPQPTAEQSLNVTVSASPLAAGGELETRDA
jgi:hypothetical protein